MKLHQNSRIILDSFTLSLFPNYSSIIPAPLPECYAPLHLASLRYYYRKIVDNIVSKLLELKIFWGRRVGGRACAHTFK